MISRPALRLALCAVLAVTLSSGSTPRAQSDSLDDGFAAYADGHRDDAIAQLRRQTLTVGTFASAGTRWISAAIGEPERSKRQRAAAMFAIELVWQSTRTPDDVVSHRYDGEDISGINNSTEFAWQNLSMRSWKSTFPVVAWACVQMPQSGPVDDGERAWWHASIAMLEDAQVWHALTGGERKPKAVDVFSPAVRELVDGHVRHARSRLGDVPWLRMAEAVAETTGPLLHSQHESPWISADHVLRDEGEQHPGDVNRAIKIFTPLRGEPVLAAEIDVRLGRLDLRRHKWADALQHFARARDTTRDAFLLAASDYLAGWAYEQLKHDEDAIAAYRRARTFAPTARNLNVRLSALLYGQGDRTGAYALLDEALHVLPPPMDLLSQLERGDGRAVPNLIAAMRETSR